MNNQDDRHVIPTEHHDLTIVSGRVVRVETKHMAESVWVAKGLMSEQIPTGPLLSPSRELSATGRTEREAIDTLRRRIAQMDRAD